jgi:hypothetical protein
MRVNWDRSIKKLSCFQFWHSMDGRLKSSEAEVKWRAETHVYYLVIINKDV